MNIRNVCLCGGGSQTHVIGAWLSARGYSVTILTRRPGAWRRDYTVNLPGGGTLTADISAISAEAADVVPQADVVLLTVPGPANRHELEKIRPYLRPECWVGGVFCSSGFFFEAMEVLPSETKLWGFQRVPFIARVADYGHTANLTGTRPEYKIAVERATDDEKRHFADWIGEVFDGRTVLLKNYLEASITNSNPILHTSRLYSMFAGWTPEMRSPRNMLFYEEWTEDAARLLIEMDSELSALLEKLPVTPGYLTPILEYYESTDAVSLACKLSSIAGFKGIKSPMAEVEGGWVPDYGSRYFTEDFGYSLRYIYELAKARGVPTPTIDKVYLWGASKLCLAKRKTSENH